uniref:Mediator of RNA polymerase II complex transcriptional regulation, TRANSCRIPTION n=1 Tax=Siphoviridae sp. ctRNB7 TaxID=2825502 RepID=A0A8S5PWL6_9CAUD|nr:MAG TPA: Mediator of RNA polymerase II complex transcriptional regulation, TRANSCRIPTION [Siphoviridae sp. ctRNB7]
MKTTLTNKYESEVLSATGYIQEGELSEALLQSIDRGLRNLEVGRKKSNEEVQTGARMLIERWKKQLEN